MTRPCGSFMNVRGVTLLALQGDREIQLKADEHVVRVQVV